MEKQIPEFMREYYNGSNTQGRKAIEKLAEKYENERRTFFETTFNAKQQFQRDWNKLTGGKELLTHEKAWAPHHNIYQEQVKAVAVANGCKQTVQPKPYKHSDAPPIKTKTSREQFLDNMSSMRKKQQQKIRPKQ